MSWTSGSEEDYGVEQWAAKVFGWERVNAPYCDLFAPDDTPIEAKGCARWTSNGDARTRGRFRLWSRQHDELVNECGKYLFVVYPSYDQWDEPFAWRTLPATAVGRHIDDFSNHTYRPSKGTQRKVTWPQIMEIDDIRYGEYQI